MSPWGISPHHMLVMPFSLWLVISIAILPRFIRNPRVLGPIVFVIGAPLAWVASLDSPYPWTISDNLIFAILATGLALLHSEVRFRRANGYWRILGPARSA